MYTTLGPDHGACCRGPPSAAAMRRTAASEWFDAECGWICKEPCAAESLASGGHSPTAGEGFTELLAKIVDVVLAGVVHGLADDKDNVCVGADR
jgi:hypothetical protein